MKRQKAGAGPIIVTTSRHLWNASEPANGPESKHLACPTGQWRNSMTAQQAPFAKQDLEKAGTQVRPRSEVADLASFLSSPGMKAQIQAALPKHMTPERMARIVTTEIRKNQGLVKCDRNSFLGAVIQCAQLGLEPGNSLGHAYILPYGKQAQLIVGYRGMIDLARRSGQIVSISARTVHEGDEFAYRYGLEESLTHRPSEEC